ncbi:DUF968 domain-containing protein [Candidatus Pacearchaeota archaeon]|nr:DUF968 domain-containing protein [Candidatus Pacearchaeota archaeon]
MSKKKNLTAAEKKYLSRIAEQGCCACRFVLGYHDTPASIHHIRDGQGGSQRAPTHETLPLCPIHHQTGGYGVAIHSGEIEWESKFGTERELLAMVHEDYINTYGEPIPVFL